MGVNDGKRCAHSGAARAGASNGPNRLARILRSYLDRRCTFWTSIENKPRSFVSGVLQQKRGVRSGLPDVVVIHQLSGRLRVVFVELKSRHGPFASKTQNQVRTELLRLAGVEWWMARSARAAMTALYRSGVSFRRPWKPPPLEPWEGPFADPHKRLPQEPRMAAQRREDQRRWNRRYRERKKAVRRAAADAAAA